MGLSQQQMVFAESPEFDLPIRVYFAALGKMDRMGHARFGRGELIADLVDGGQEDGRAPAGAK